MILLTGIYSLIEIIDTCEVESNCIYVYGVPISRIHVFYKIPLIVLNVIVLFILYALIGYLYYSNSFIHQRLTNSHKKASDFSVMLSGINHEIVTE
jgi:hypothetical protein